MANEGSIDDSPDVLFAHAQKEADDKYRDLIRLFLEVRFDAEILLGLDGLCLDVERGLDIDVLTRLEVPHIVASEQVSRLPQNEQLTARNMINAFSKASDTHHIPVYFLERSAQDCVSSLAEKNPRPQFGIITRFSMHPSDIDAESLTTFVDTAMPLLADGGIMMLTVLDSAELPVLREVGKRQQGKLQSEIRVVREVTVEGRQVAAIGAIGTYALIFSKNQSDK